MIFPEKGLVYANPFLFSVNRIEDRNKFGFHGDFFIFVGRKTRNEIYNNPNKSSCLKKLRDTYYY